MSLAHHTGKNLKLDNTECCLGVDKQEPLRLQVGVQITPLGSNLSVSYKFHNGKPYDPANPLFLSAYFVECAPIELPRNLHKESQTRKLTSISTWK